MRGEEEEVVGEEEVEEELCNFYAFFDSKRASTILY